MRKTILASLVLLPSLALASGYSLPNVNPRDLAMSASAVAAQVDSSAAFTNPAALARLEGVSLKAGSSFLNMWETWKDPTGAFPDSKIKNSVVYLPVASFSYSSKLPMLGNRGWGAGVAFSPFGGGAVEWPEDWPGRYRITKVDRKVWDIIGSVAVEVIPQVRIGAGVFYTYTTETLEQKAFMVPFTVPLNPAQPDATATLDLSGGAVSYDLSLEVDPLKGVPLRLAVDYKHKVNQELDGDVKWDNLAPGFLVSPTPAPLAPFKPLFTNQNVKEKLTIPNRLNVAAAYRVVKPLLVTFTWTLDRWVVYSEDRFIGDAGAQLVVPRNYRNGNTYRAGAEYDVSKDFQVRAGVQRDVSGLRTSTYSPTLPDASSWAGSLGATYRFAHGLSVDAAVFYANMDEVKATNTGVEPPAAPQPTPGTTFRGTYDIQALIYGVTVAWKPGKT